MYIIDAGSRQQRLELMLGKAGLAADRIGSNIDHLCDMVLLQATDEILRRTLLIAERMEGCSARVEVFILLDRSVFYAHESIIL